MAMPPIDFNQAILDTASNSGDLPLESSSPWEHYRRSANDAWNLVLYMDRNVARVNHYSKPFDRHMSRLHGMALANLVGAFERFLKELAVVCVNELSGFSLDGRLDEFSLKGSVAAANFKAETVGNALCEADTWLSCPRVNDKFRGLLADPFEAGGKFYVFPMKKGHGSEEELMRSRQISAIFQLRHTLVHNLGVITESDAIKLRQFLKSSVDGKKLLTPSSKNVRQIKRLLDETASDINKRMSLKLASLMTTLHQDNYLSFDPSLKAQDLVAAFKCLVTVCGQTSTP